MHSSRAACVFGEARFTSSTSSRLVKTGPARNSKVFVRWSKTFTPVTSEGSRSGVNCRREKSQSSVRASAFANIVFPTPGKSSMIRCPSATRQRTTSRSVSSAAWTTRRRLATTAATRSFATGATARSAKEALHLVEDRRRDLVLRGFRQRPLGGNPRHQRHLVVGGVEADVRSRHIVVDDEIDVFAVQLVARSLEARVTLIRGEADEHLSGAARRAEGLEDVRRRLELDRPGSSV